MSRLPLIMGTLVVVLAAGGAGFVAGRHEPPILSSADWLKPFLAAVHASSPAKSAAAGPIVYYRDPNGPSYSAVPTDTTDGRPFVAVHASEDVHFDEVAAAESTDTAMAAPSELGPKPEGEKHIKFYRNPMGLPDTSPVPKKDSMGMDYIPVFTGDDQDGSTLKLSPGKLQRTGVRSEAAAMRTFATTVRAAGTVQLDERRQSVIALRFDAYIDKVENITTGSVVRQGQPLMLVYGPELLAPAAQYLSALNEKADPASMKSTRRRLENFDVPDGVIAQIDRTREIPQSLVWPSPRTGIVVERKAVDGMKASAGETLFRLADLSVVWVVADFPESDLPLVSIGEPVSVKPRGTDRSSEGKVALIYPSINKETRTARLRVELSNPDGLLMPDMYADVEIATGSKRPVLAVPNDALIDGGDRKVVIVDKGEGRLEPRNVKTGRRGDGFVEITDGIADKDRIVVGANFLIDAESNLNSALHGLNAPGDSQ